MKTKLFIMAALLIAALSSCTKNKELNVYRVENDTDSTCVVVCEHSIIPSSREHAIFIRTAEVAPQKEAQTDYILSQGSIADPSELYASISCLTLSGDTIMHLSPVVISAWELRENIEYWEHNTIVTEHIYTLHITYPSEK